MVKGVSINYVTCLADGGGQGLVLCHNGHYERSRVLRDGRGVEPVRFSCYIINELKKIRQLIDEVSWC